MPFNVGGAAQDKSSNAADVLKPRNVVRSSAVLRSMLSGLTLGMAGALVLAQTMAEVFSHDEHQFVAAGWLLGVKGLLPYRDFPFQHLPNLSLVYAVLGRLTPYLLLNARLISACFALGTLVLLFSFARRRLGVHGFWYGWLAGTGAVLFLILSPLFSFANGRAWNHALPTCLTVASFCVVVMAGEKAESRLMIWFFGGGLLGFSAGARASFIPVLVPFAVYLFRRGAAGGPRTARRLLGIFLTGFGFGLVPALLMATIAPQQFVYGNLIYPLQNTQYRRLLLHDDAMDLPSKLIFFADQVLLDPPHLLLALAGLALACATLARTGWKKVQADTRLAIGTAVVLWLAALVPTPSWYQYFYAPMPFVVLALIDFLAQGRMGKRIQLVAMALLIAALVAIRGEKLGQLRLLAHPADWLPVRVHRVGEAISRISPLGPVLTLAPLIPLEGGMEIYPAFSTGSLTWRVSPFMDRAARQRYGVISPADLAGYLMPEPPTAILIGFELQTEGFSVADPGGLELPLEVYAQAHGYWPTQMPCAICPGRELRVWTEAAW